MPFANMADEDLVAIVSYLRTAEPIRNDVPTARWTLMGKGDLGAPGARRVPAGARAHAASVGSAAGGHRRAGQVSG